MLDARAWFLWVLATLVAVSSARNPLYTLLLLLITSVVATVCRRRDGAVAGQQAALSPLRFAAFAVPISALFNALTVHIGDTELLRLPGWLPLLGGRVTLEALAFGIQNGLVLTGIFSGFAVFGQMTAVRDLVGLVPRAFHEAGVVMSIALTYAPQTLRSLKRIRQAQAVRGHRVRGLRDWPPIVLPLLVSGLERSMGLAEAMVARGYGATSDKAQPVRTTGGLAVGLLALLGGWLMFLFRPNDRAGPVWMVAGSALVVGVVWFAGRSARHTVYRPRRWTVRDTWIVAGCALALAVVLLPSPTGLNTLYYSPYPHLTPPPFDPWVGLGLLGLLMPVLVGTAISTPPDTPRTTGAEPAIDLETP